MNKGSNKMLVNLLGAFTVLFWGASYPLTKIAMTSFSSDAVGFLRCLIAAIFVTVSNLIIGIKKKPAMKDVPMYLLCGGVGFAGFVYTYSLGLKTLPSSTSSLIVALSPIITAVISVAFMGEKIRPKGWAAMGLAFLGVVLILSGGGKLEFTSGAAWTVLSAAVFAIYNIMARKLAEKGYTALEALMYSLWAATLCFAVIAPGAVTQIPGASMEAILAVAGLGTLASGLGYVFWNKGLAIAENTSDVTNYMFITPVVSTVTGLIMLHEMPTIFLLIGGAVIVASLVMFQKRK